jgi:hypothetical protein
MCPMLLGLERKLVMLLATGLSVLWATNNGAWQGKYDYHGIC